MNLQEAFERKWIVYWYGIVSSDAFLNIVDKNETRHSVRLHDFPYVTYTQSRFIANRFLSKHMNLFPNLPWKYKKEYVKFQQYFPYLTFDIVLKHEQGWCWNQLSCHPNITMQNILDNQHLPWDWYYVAQNPNLTVDVLRNFPYDEHIWVRVSENSNLTMQWLLDYPNYPWKIAHICSNGGITMVDIENNPQYKWSWFYVSFNPNLTIQFVMKHINKPWCWEKISRHENITMDDINNNPTCGWDWKQIGDNPNLTFEMIVKNKNKQWGWGYILQNEFKPDKNIYIDNGFAILFISTIHGFYQQDDVRCGISFTAIECVFFDEYLVKCIANNFRQTVHELFCK